ncbi:MAG TPA: hypothetical protein VNZ26_35250, partial [Vicinamibacterales bacterium]|nr:hypothetical protein [Vicinamibacterales bacterium]
DVGILQRHSEAIAQVDEGAQSHSTCGIAGIGTTIERLVTDSATALVQRAVGASPVVRANGAAIGRSLEMAPHRVQ